MIGMDALTRALLRKMIILMAIMAQKRTRGSASLPDGC